VSKVLFPTLSL